MPQPTNAVSRYNINGVREDLINAIFNTSPEETPVTSDAGVDTAKQTFHQWQRDSLRAPNAGNAAIDGDDAVGSVKAATQQLGNFTQIFQDTVVTTGRANKVVKAGRSSEQSYQIAKAYKELQRDMEARALSNLPAVAGNNTTAMQTGGLGVQIFTNASHGAGGSTAAHTANAPTTAPTAGTARAFTVTLLEDQMQAAFIATGKAPDQIYMSPAHKRLASTFVGIAVNRVDMKKGESQGAVVAGADIYVSNFGTVKFIPHYIMAAAGLNNRVFGLNLKTIDVAFLRPFQKEVLGKTGDSEKHQVLVDAAICVRSENSNFKIDDLTP